MKTASLILILFSAFNAAADGGILGASGQYTADVGGAAQTNRQVADQLFQQALSDEKAALSSFPPNIALLARAGSNALSGFQADSQSKNFAQGSVNAMNTGQNSGQFETKNYGAMDEAKLRELATTSSPFAGEVKAHLSTWGIKMDENGTSIELPLGLGKVPLSLGASEMEGGMKAAAQVLGYDPNEISKGLKQAQDQREQIVAAVGSASSSSEAAGASQRAVASAKTTGGVEGAAEGGAAALVAATEGEAKLNGQNSITDMQVDLALEKQKLSEFRSKLSAGSEADLLVKGSADQDIFNMVHIRYQTLRRQEAFLETIDLAFANSN